MTLSVDLINQQFAFDEYKSHYQLHLKNHLTIGKFGLQTTTPAQ